MNEAPRPLKTYQSYLVMMTGFIEHVGDCPAARFAKTLHRGRDEKQSTFSTACYKPWVCTYTKERSTKVMRVS